MQEATTIKPTEIIINAQDLDWVISVAVKRVLEGIVDRGLDNKQFIAKCYVEAVDALINKNGLKVNICYRASE